MDIYRTVSHTLRTVGESSVAWVCTFFELFLGSCSVVDIAVVIEELAGVDLFLAPETLVLRDIELLESLSVVLVVAAPFYLLVPVEDRCVVHLASLSVLGDEIFVRIYLTEIGAGQRVAHVVHELTVFIVGDLCLIHEE